MNNPTWDLTIFYQGFDDPKLRGDVEEIRALAAGAEALIAREEPAGEKLEAILDLEEKLQTLTSRAMGYTALTLEADNTNAEAMRWMDELSMLRVDVELAFSLFGRYVGGVENLE